MVVVVGVGDSGATGGKMDPPSPSFPAPTAVEGAAAAAAVAVAAAAAAEAGAVAAGVDAAAGAVGAADTSDQQQLYMVKIL